MPDRYPGSLSPGQERRIRAIEERLRAAEKARKSADATSTKRLIVSEKNIKTTEESLSAHKAALDPHPQYTTDAEATTIADSAVSTHAAAADPHPNYLTQAEGDSLYGSAGFDDNDLDGGDADQHFVGLLVDGGDVDDPPTGGVADGGDAATVHGPGGAGGSTVMTQEAYDADGDGIVGEAEALNDGSKSATAAQVRDHIDAANPHSGSEPTFTKKTGFNLDLGTAAGTVSEGNHTHGIDDLTDVDTSTTPPADGEVLKWVAADSAWKPGTDGGGGGGGSGESTQKTATQVAHGLAVQECVRLSGTSFVKANASTEADAEVVGIVTAVADADNFTYVMDGYASGFSGLTAGEVYFLQDDETLGLEPGTINKPVLVALSATEGIFVNYRGTISSAGGTAVGTRLNRTTDQAISDSALEAIIFDEEFIDEGGYWSAGDPTNIYPSAGWHVLHLMVRFAASSAGDRRLVQLRHEDSGGNLKDFVVQEISGTSGGAGTLLRLSIPGVFDIAAGDKIQALVFQNSGAPLNIIGNNIRFNIAKLTAGGGAGGITDLSDVDTLATPPVQADGLVFDGSLWVPGFPAMPTNLMRRSRFISSTGWSASSGVTAGYADTDIPTVSRLRRHGRLGRVNLNVSTSGDRYLATSAGYHPRVEADESYFFGVWCKTIAWSGSSPYMRLIVRASGGGVLGDINVAGLAAGSDWTFISGAAVMPATAAYIEFRLQAASPGTGDVKFAGLIMARGNVLLDYVPNPDDWVSGEMWA